MGCGRASAVALEWGLDPSASRPGDCGCGGEPCPCGCSSAGSADEIGFGSGDPRAVRRTPVEMGPGLAPTGFDEDGLVARRHRARRSTGHSGATARKSGKDIQLGDDWKPNDGDAQGGALHATLTSLFQGLYQGDQEAFWTDLESILSWDNPAWRNPDPYSPGCGPVPVSECGGPPVWPEGEFVRVPVVPPGDAFEFEGSFTDCEQDLMGHAWGLLLENLAIIEWAQCIANRMARQNGSAFQEQEDEECISRALLGERSTPVRFEKNTVRLGCKMGAGPDRVLFMCVAGPNNMFDRAVSLYCHGDAAARRCAVLAMAASLLHELSHTCGYNHGKPIVPCSIPYLLGSLFAWAVQQRYPNIADDPCCKRYRNIGLGEDVALPGFSEDCV